MSKSANPDVALFPAVYTTNNVYYYYNYWAYWGWYYPYGGYGWYYPYYYPTTVSSYRTGSLIIQMATPKSLTPTDQIPVVWTALFNGMLEGGDDYIFNRIQSSIDQAFTQSPYLQH